MKTTQFPLSLLFIVLVLAFSSCRREDLGPLQEEQRTYALSNFSSVELASAFKVNITQGTSFGIVVRGDRRNLDDLDVWVSNQTLHASYRTNRNRQYSTEFDLVMPTLTKVDFSGAVSSTIGSFTNPSDFYLHLSGASKADVQNMMSNSVQLSLSGASEVNFRGTLREIEVEASGASSVNAFDAPAEEGYVDASGASQIKVHVSRRLHAKATGASSIRYRGTPEASINSSGGSSIQKE